MTMKDNQNGTSFDSRSFGMETDALSFGSKEKYNLNGSKMDTNLAELEVKDRDNYSNVKVRDDCSVDDENGTMDSPRKEGQNGLSRDLILGNGREDFPRMECKDGLAHLSSWDKDADSSSTDSYDMEKEQGSPERESFDTVDDLADCNARDSRDSGVPEFTDKNVLECDVPEFEVCYRENDCQLLKDICIDEGSPEKDVNAIGSGFCPLPPKEDPLLDAENITAEPCGCGSREENDGIRLISQEEKSDSRLQNLFDKDTIKNCEPENTVKCFPDSKPCCLVVADYSRSGMSQAL